MPKQHGENRENTKPEAELHETFNSFLYTVSMLKKFILPVAATALVAMTSCSGKLGALSDDNFTFVHNPMETQGGYFPVTINGTLP